ncbi:MAG: molybdenum ABC transporter ATP-binding protein [Alphaproteobacteria bacterium]|nr:molybdenum ABC transporter ATP-binding protein [Alphaproteobacteria bacterium]
MIEVDVRQRRGSFQLDAEFSTGDGRLTALFGRSGAGKTTLINLLAGLDRPDEGRIAVDGVTLFDSKSGTNLPPEQRRLGYVFQDGRLFPHMTVRRNLLFGHNGAPDRQEIHSVVRLLELNPLLQRRPKTLSGGEKQRVAIGRALLSRPRLLLMDEPLASLDAGHKAEILDYIERLRDESGVPIVYVSHASEEVVRLADTLVLLSEGKVAAVGPLESLMSRLDLRPLTGRYEAGAVVSAIVAEEQRDADLTMLSFAGGALRVPKLDIAPGQELRLRLRARDVALALSPPTDVSILNVFPGVVQEIGEEDGPQVDVLIDIGCPIWARITQHARRQLDIKQGKPVYALIKGVSFDRRSLGYGGPPRTDDAVPQRSGMDRD